MTHDHEPKKCNRPQCHGLARHESEYCSDECRELVKDEMDTAPYGDQYLFPAIPMQ